MPKRDDPCGEIACPLCKRPADVVKFNERTKLDPEGGAGKPSYARKFYVVCPPVRGYTGCGSILANSPNAQDRLLELATFFGPEGKPAALPPAPAPAPAVMTTPAPAPLPPPPKPEPRKRGILW